MTQRQHRKYSKTKAACHQTPQFPTPKTPPPPLRRQNLMRSGILSKIPQRFHHPFMRPPAHTRQKFHHKLTHDTLLPAKYHALPEREGFHLKILCNKPSLPPTTFLPTTFLRHNLSVTSTHTPPA